MSASETENPDQNHTPEFLRALNSFLDDCVLLHTSSPKHTKMWHYPDVSIWDRKPDQNHTPEFLRALNSFSGNCILLHTSSPKHTKMWHYPDVSIWDRKPDQNHTPEFLRALNSFSGDCVLLRSPGGDPLPCLLQRPLLFSCLNLAGLTWELKFPAKCLPLPISPGVVAAWTIFTGEGHLGSTAFLVSSDRTMGTDWTLTMSSASSRERMISSFLISLALILKIEKRKEETKVLCCKKTKNIQHENVIDLITWYMVYI